MTVDPGDELRDHRLREIEVRLQALERLMNAEINNDIKSLEIRITHLEDTFAAVLDKIDDLRTASCENRKASHEILSVLNEHVMRENKDRVLLLYAVVGALVSGFAALFYEFAFPHLHGI